VVFISVTGDYQGLTRVNIDTIGASARFCQQEFEGEFEEEFEKNLRGGSAGAINASALAYAIRGLPDDQTE
jgi:glycerate kinase